MNRTRILVFAIVVLAHILILAGLSAILAAGRKNAERMQEIQIEDFQYAGNPPGGEPRAALPQAMPSAPAPRPETVDPGDETDDSPKTQLPAQGSDDNASSVARSASGPGGPGGSGSGDGDGSESDFMPMQKISQLPVIAENSVRSKLVYPEMARKAGIEGTVYLELFIDSIGKIRKIAILKETPSGYGFASAAMSAFEGCTCLPAKSEGKTVSVRYRYPIRFSLN